MTTTYAMKARYFDGEYSVFTSTYNDHSLAVCLVQNAEEEVISINLSGYDFRPHDSDQFYVKNYSEHSGLADALVAAGIAEKIPGGTVSFGSFGTTASLMRLIVTPMNGSI